MQRTYTLWRNVIVATHIYIKTHYYQHGNNLWSVEHGCMMNEGQTRRVLSCQTWWWQSTSHGMKYRDQPSMSTCLQPSRDLFEFHSSLIAISFFELLMNLELMHRKPFRFQFYNFIIMCMYPQWMLWWYRVKGLQVNVQHKITFTINFNCCHWVAFQHDCVWAHYFVISIRCNIFQIFLLCNNCSRDFLSRWGFTDKGNSTMQMKVFLWMIKVFTLEFRSQDQRWKFTLSFALFKSKWWKKFVNIWNLATFFDCNQKWHHETNKFKQT